MPPSPPSFLLVLFHASRLYSESVDANTTEAPRSLNCGIASLKAMISVGHTNVHAMGTKPSTSHCFVEVKAVSDKSVELLLARDHLATQSAELKSLSAPTASWLLYGRPMDC